MQLDNSRKIETAIKENLSQYPRNKTQTKPMYDQIATQIKIMIMDDELQAGAQLPSMRELSKTIHVSTITIKAAMEKKDIKTAIKRDEPRYDNEILERDSFARGNNEP
jgi:DNA-binding transcriptional MocR family regulator